MDELLKRHKKRKAKRQMMKSTERMIAEYLELKEALIELDGKMKQAFRYTRAIETELEGERRRFEEAESKMRWALQLVKQGAEDKED